MSIIDPLYADDDGGGGSGDSRPEGLQDKFWDPAGNTVRVGEMSKAYNDLEVSFTRKSEDLIKDLDTQRLAKRPESAEKYDFKLPDSIETPPGFKLTMQPDHPLVNFWREQAWANGMDQAGFEAGVAQFVQGEIGRLPVIADEVVKLGENGQERMTRAQDFMKTVTSEEEFAQLGGLVTTSQGIGVVEKIMAKLGSPLHQSDVRGAGDPEDDFGNQPHFDNKTRKLMAEKGYQDGEAGAIAAVRARWAKAYPGSQEPERNNPRSR